MAERTHIIGYLTHAGLIAGLIFPPIAEAVWGSGGFMRRFLAFAMQDVKFHDCAGSGVVHLLGGVAALAGNSLLGRRIMRPEEPDMKVSPFGRSQEEEVDLERDRPETYVSPCSSLPNGRWQRRFDNAERDNAEFQPCNYLQVMGMFILWVGWYGFNTGGALTSHAGSYHTAGLVAWNTTMAGAAGGFGAYLYLYGFRLNLDVGFLCNGLLSGLVSITACCDITTPVQSIIIGLMAGLIVYPTTSNLMRRMRLDDPVDAVPVHAASGLFGVLAVGFCRPDCAVLAEVGFSEVQRRFCQEGHQIGWQLLAQLWGSMVIIVWTFLISYTFWLLLALGESLKSLELEHVSRAEQLLRQLGHGQTPEVNKDLVSAAHLSRTVRRALKEHGWTGTMFLTGQPHDMLSLLAKLQQAQGGSLDTALEMEVCRPLRWLVRCCRRWWLCRELAVARLRIHPWAEISGLGAAETDGGKLYQAIQRAATQVAELRSQTTAEPLQNEVRELGMLVRSQDILLRRLMSRRYSNLSGSRRLQRVPERAGPGQESSSQEGSRPASPDSPRCQVPLDDYASESQLSTARSLRSARSSRTAWDGNGNASFPFPSGFRIDLRSETASTVSDASMGALSPHSVASTPPPTIHGRLRPRDREASPRVMNVADQLVQMLQMQQQLLSAIGAPQLASQASVAAPASEPFSEQAALLSRALQQVADNASSPVSVTSSRRSTATEPW
ncbi:unnamed protein product [Effrenium voratum]|nr:unnamed protein product [Effrenium voratum]